MLLSWQVAVQPPSLGLQTHPHQESQNEIYPMTGVEWGWGGVEVSGVHEWEGVEVSVGDRVDYCTVQCMLVLFSENENLCPASF